MTTPSPVRPNAPAPDRAAFLLDFDGTLVDIAPTPDSVQVEPDLIRTLQQLKKKCGGALAIVTGRPIAQIDHFLPGIPTAVAGEHGLTLRRLPGEDVEPVAVPPLPRDWIDAATSLVKRYPGAGFEHKLAGLVLHYRGAPDAGPVFLSAINAWLAGQNRFEIHSSKMAWEIRPAGIHKGGAVDTLMSATPFANRIPVFVGDDVTDLDGARAARSLGGEGYLIPDDFPTASAFRSWLATYAETA